MEVDLVKSFTVDPTTRHRPMVVIALPSKKSLAKASSQEVPHFSLPAASWVWQNFSFWEIYTAL